MANKYPWPMPAASRMRTDASLAAQDVREGRVWTTVTRSRGAVYVSPIPRKRREILHERSASVFWNRGSQVSIVRGRGWV